MADHRDDETPEDVTRKAETAARQQEFTRRALIRAGWIAPLVTTVNIPSASAQSPTPHNDAHGDSVHIDQITIHLDGHLDTPGPLHQDHIDHTDSPHSDAPHTDAPHTDTPHTDAPHTDAPHTDAPHTDA